MVDNTKSLPGVTNYVDFGDKIYYSFWSWQLMKNCPRSFKLRVLTKRPFDKKESKHNAIQGSIPGTQSEMFFRLPLAQRDMNFFFDTFDHYWQAFIKDNYVDFAAVAKQYIKEKGMDIQNDDPEYLYKFGYQLRLDETKQHCINLMKLISSMGLHRMDALTEEPFKVIIEEGREERGMKIPEMAIGGRIDLVILLDDKRDEIWDVKAVKSPSSLDTDQLLLYKMGRQAPPFNRQVERVGYLHAKQGKAETKKFLPMHESALKTQMRQSMYYFRNDQWPANYVEYKCRFCDVRDECDVFQQREAGVEEVKKMKTGKIEF